MKVIKLPVAEITVTLDGDRGAVTSNLFRDQAPETTDDLYDDGALSGYQDALYTMLLAHAQAGIDITTPAYVKGVQAVIDSITDTILYGRKSNDNG